MSMSRATINSRADDTAPVELELLPPQLAITKVAKAIPAIASRPRFLVLFNL